MQKLKFFAFTTGVLLFLELFAPYGFAQPVQPASAQQAVSLQASVFCRVSEMTPQEVQSLWANTLGFSPNEINFLPFAEALKNMQDAGKHRFPPSVQGAVIGGEEISLIQVAGILGVSEQQAAKDLRLREYCQSLKAEEVKPCLDKYFDDKGRVKTTASIPVSVAEKYAQQVGKPKNFVVEQLQKMGLLPGRVTGIAPEEKPGKCRDLKIVVAGGTPGRNEASLCDLLKAQEMNPKQCALDNENIQGRVTYAVLLDKDLNYCSSTSKQCQEGKFVSSASGEEVDQLDSEQHLVGSEVTGFMNLGANGANMLIPSFYEDWVSYSSTWNKYDLLVSTILAVGSLHFGRAASEELAAAKAELSELRASQAQGTRAAQFFSETSQSYRDLENLLRTNPTGVNPLDIQFTREVTNRLGSESAKKVRDKLAVGNLYLTGEELDELFGVTGNVGRAIPAEFQTEVGQVARSMQAYKSVEDPVKKLEAETKLLKKRADAYADIAKYAGRRVYLGLILGATWLGPARILYSINDRVFFSLKGSTPAKDSFAKLYVNHPEIAGKFRKASDLFGTGRLLESVANTFGTSFSAPSKAFSAGKVFLINNPKGIDSSNSFTSISTADNIKIKTSWRGDSYATNFEDVSSFSENDKYTSLQFKLYNTFPNVVVNTKNQAILYSYVLTLIPQFIFARGVAQTVGAPSILGITTFLLVNDYIVSFDPYMYKGQECDKATLAHFKTGYAASTIAGWALMVLPSLSLFKKIALAQSAWVKAPIGTLNFINNIQTPFAFQWYFGSKAQQYVSSCADPEYKVLTYQKLPEAVKKKVSGVAEKLQPVTDVLSQLGIGTAAQQAFQQKENPLSKMTEILNFKAGLKDQKGFVQPEALYYLQIEKSVFSAKGGLFDQLAGKGCPFAENYLSNDKAVRLSATDGIAFYDKNGNTLQKFDSDDWKLRALARLMTQENGRVILPNKLFEANIAGCAGTLLNILYDGRISFATSCNAIDCLKQQLSALTKRIVSDDLTPFLGRVSTVVTDKGVTSISGNEISFTRVSSTSGKIGTEVNAPSIDDKNTLQQTQLLGSTLQVSSDGRVFLSGPTGSSVSGQEIGFLKTIIGSQGKIEFDTVNKRLYLFVYVLSASGVQAIKDFGVVGTAKNADGSTTPKLSITEKTGMESGLQQALQQIQGAGGIQSFETKDHIYAFTKDAQGNPILRVIDKKTGQATDYRITGEPYRDANGNLVVPTDKGNFVFGFKQGPDGGPWVEAKGPDGLSEFLPLLAARGQNGILTFNPTTGAINVYNGQDIPLSPEFAQKGIAFSGDAAGNVRGVPQDNFFAPPAPTTTAGGGVSPLALPSWPRELLAFLAMLAALAASIALVRLKYAKRV